MSQSFFRFKQFCIHQEHCAMKVSTDACIQGAWSPVPSAAARILDIGAGTGLLALMMAQRCPDAVVDAIEINGDAARQAAANVAASPFNNRISIITGNAVSWQPQCRYDFIICNPPFFSNALRGPDAARNTARHIDGLDADMLIRLSLNLLSADGTASFLWPADVFGAFKQKAEAVGLYLQHQLCMKHRAGNPTSRIAGIFGRAKPAHTEAFLLIIKDKDESYTQEFAALLRPFYLHL